jgi:hypothetical protein
MTTRPYVGRCCVILLRDSVERNVPVEATDLVPQVPERINSPVCLASIRQLQATYAKIKRQLLEERPENEQRQSADQDMLAGKHMASNGIDSSQSIMGTNESSPTGNTVSGDSDDLPANSHQPTTQQLSGGAT